MLPCSVYVVCNKTWYEAYAMRHRALPRTQEMFGALPAVKQWEEIQNMSFHQFNKRCRKTTLEQRLVIGMRDLDQAARQMSLSDESMCRIYIGWYCRESCHRLSAALRHIQYGRIHQSLEPFDGEFPKHHVLRVRDLFDTSKKRFRGGDPWLKRTTKKGKRIRSSPRLETIRSIDRRGCFITSSFHNATPCSLTAWTTSDNRATHQEYIACR